MSFNKRLDFKVAGMPIKSMYTSIENINTDDSYVIESFRGVELTVLHNRVWFECKSFDKMLKLLDNTEMILSENNIITDTFNLGKYIRILISTKEMRGKYGTRQVIFDNKEDNYYIGISETIYPANMDTIVYSVYIQYKNESKYYFNVKQMETAFDFI